MSNNRKIVPIHFITCCVVCLLLAAQQIDGFEIKNSEFARLRSIRQAAKSTINRNSYYYTNQKYEWKLSASKKSDDEATKGMEAAFGELEKMIKEGNNPFAEPEPAVSKEDFLAAAKKNLDLTELGNIENVSPEAEAKLYKEVASELEGVDELDLAASLEADMEKAQQPEQPDLGTILDLSKVDSSATSAEDFMQKAFDEALSEVRDKTNVKIDKDAILDNKSLMKQIEDIFDKANDELMEGLEEMRTEQMALARSSAEKNAKESSEKMEDDDKRLVAAEENMRTMLAKVNEETRSVQEAVEELQKAQANIDSGVVGQLSSLKSGGIIKQVTLVGTVLFTLRSTAEGFALLSGDQSHLMPAIIQAAIAVVCLIAFIFL